MKRRCAWRILSPFYYAKPIMLLMLPKTISLSTRTTEPCVCCKGNSAVRKSVDPNSLRIVRMTEEGGGEIDVDFVECHVCGYAWYEIDIDRVEDASLVNVVHDVSSGLPGQPINATASSRPPSFLVTAKLSSEVMVDRLGDIDDWMKHYFCPLFRGAPRKPMTEQAFRHELNQRRKERRSVVHN